MRQELKPGPALHTIEQRSAVLPSALAEALAVTSAASGRAMHTVEVGGSSVQSAVLCEPAELKFTDGPIPDDGSVLYGLAAPGLVVDGRVFGAHHLGWDGTYVWRELGYSHPPEISMNDAEAAALGEWLLRRDRSQPPASLLYVGIGTGVGGSLVTGGEIVPVELSHQPGFGDEVCGGCGRKGCLDAQIGGHALPGRLTRKDKQILVEKLGTAISRTGAPAHTVVVFAGGLVRSYPDLVATLQTRLADSSHQVEPTAAPVEAKSAAYVGLFDRLVNVWRDNAPSSK